MTYKERMKTDHPTVDSNFILFSCPGHYIFNGPTAGSPLCPNKDGVKCVDCWGQEIPDKESAEKTKLDLKAIAARIKESYTSLRDEGLNDHEAFEITKIIISAEVQHALSRM